jgi:hypothetical protein
MIVTDKDKGPLGDPSTVIGVVGAQSIGFGAFLPSSRGEPSPAGLSLGR